MKIFKKLAHYSLVLSFNPENNTKKIRKKRLVHFETPHVRSNLLDQTEKKQKQERVQADVAD